MKDLIIIFAGGGLGSVVRYLLGRWINQLAGVTFPYGTLTVNVIACIVLGAVVGLVDQRNALSQTSRIFWTIGFCGGFSTFSTFSLETVNLFNNSQGYLAIAYVLASVVLCIGAILLGMWISRSLIS